MKENLNFQKNRWCKRIWSNTTHDCKESL